jgi:hypothetical protein
MNTKTKNRVWDAIVDQLSIDPDYDRNGAVKVADQVKQALQVDAKYELERIREDRRRRWGTFFRNCGWWILGIVLAAGLILGIGVGCEKYQHRAKHYARYPKHDVALVASNAVQSYYGLNDRPANMHIIREQKSAYIGIPAWKVTFESATKTICAYVWKDKDVEGNWNPRNRVLEGKDC